MKNMLNVLKYSLTGTAILATFIAGFYAGGNIFGENIVLLSPKIADDLRNTARLVKGDPNNGQSIKRKARIVYDALK